MDKKFCLSCGNKIERFVDKCPYCGFDYVKFNNPSKVKVKRGFSKTKNKEKKVKKPMFTNAEALCMGIYPKDEAYKMSIMAQMYDEEE